MRTLFAATALLLALGAAPAFADTCQSRASDGTCIDDLAPTTGQFSNSADQVGATKATNLRSTQAHANVRLAEATYVFAHNICRWIDNPGSRGTAVFIGLEAKSEWTSFIAAPPAGVDLKYCCQPATVSICGTAVKIPFGVSGKSYSYSGGYDFKATYTCGANLTGIAPTVDTSWTVATSGACSAPATTPDCGVSGKNNGDCGDDDAGSGDTHEGGGAGDNGSGHGAGGNNPGKGPGGA